MLNMETCLERNQDILHAPVSPDESVMLSVEAGLYYGLNSVGRYIWEQLESPTSLAELRDRICAEFDVDAASCEADLQRFVDDLRQQDVVRVVAP